MMHIAMKRMGESGHSSVNPYIPVDGLDAYVRPAADSDSDSDL